VVSKYSNEILIILLHCCNLFGNISRNILSDTTLCSFVLHFYDFIIRGHVSHTFIGGDILQYSSVSCGILHYSKICVQACICVCVHMCVFACAHAHAYMHAYANMNVFILIIRLLICITFGEC